MAKRQSKTAVKRKKTPGKKTPRKSKNAGLKKLYKKYKPLVLQKVGCLFIFLVIILGLFIAIFYKLHQIDISPSQPVQTDDVSVADKQAFIKEVGPIAQGLQKKYGILASISIAQASLESNFGQSQLASVYNNLYGVKTDVTDPQGVVLPTLEYIDGEMKEMNERFKVYESKSESMEAHARLIYYGTSWDQDYYQDVKAGQDYHAQAKGLQSAGYATDPDYAEKIIEMIETWELYKYD